MEIYSKIQFYILSYAVIINIIGFIIMIIDKYKARKNKWRIKESTIFIIGLIGGATGVVLGMTMFRHKTQNKKFYIGMPLIVIVQSILSIILLYELYC